MGGVLSAEALGEFSIQAQQSGVRAIYVPLDLLQREIEQTDKVNLLLISETTGNESAVKEAALSSILRERVTLADLGVQLRPVTLEDQASISLEHDSKVIDDLLARVAAETADSVHIRHSAVLSYLANSIATGERSVPYSLVTAIDASDFRSLSKDADSTKSDLPPIILNDWAAQDLGTRLGDTVTMDYYLWQEGGRLETQERKIPTRRRCPHQGTGCRSKSCSRLSGHYRLRESFRLGSTLSDRLGTDSPERRRLLA